MKPNKKNKLILLQIRRSVGELNWILPIIFQLKKKGYEIVSYFDSQETYNRLKNNQELFSIWKKINSHYFLRNKNDKIIYKIFFKIIILISRYFKLNLENFYIFNFLIKKINASDIISEYIDLKLFKFFFLTDNNYSNLFLNFKEKNLKIKVIRFPHSQYIKFRYKKKISKNDVKFGDLYLFNSFKDEAYYLEKKNIKFYANKKSLICGNLMYEKWWLNKVFKKKIKKPRKFQIVVATRCWDKEFFSKESFEYIILSIMKLVSEFKDIKIIFKIHPNGQEKTYLSELLSKFHKSKWSISDSHVINIIKSCDLGITLNTTACLDIVCMRKPCIEFWINKKINHNDIHKIDGKFKTNFQALNIVDSLDNYNDLLKRINMLKKKKIYYKKLVDFQYSHFKKINKKQIKLKELITELIKS